MPHTLDTPKRYLLHHRITAHLSPTNPCPVPRLYACANKPAKIRPLTTPTRTADSGLTASNAGVGINSQKKTASIIVSRRTQAVHAERVTDSGHPYPS